MVDSFLEASPTKNRQAGGFQGGQRQLIARVLPNRREGPGAKSEDMGRDKHARMLTEQVDGMPATKNVAPEAGAPPLRSRRDGKSSG